MIKPNVSLFSVFFSLFSFSSLGKVLCACVRGGRSLFIILEQTARILGKEDRLG